MMRDSPRWCALCGAWGDHHTDRHPVPSGEVETHARFMQSRFPKRAGEDTVELAEVETPCATCGGVKHEGGTFHPDTESFLKGLDCPDCGVETPEAAVLVAEIERLRAVLDRVDHIFYGWSYDSVYGCIENMRLLIRETLAGWTPPGGTE